MNRESVHWVKEGDLDLWPKLVCSTGEKTIRAVWKRRGREDSEIMFSSLLFLKKTQRFLRHGGEAPRIDRGQIVSLTHITIKTNIDKFKRAPNASGSLMVRSSLNRRGRRVESVEFSEDALA